MFDHQRELSFGRICQISGHAIQVELDSTLSDLTRAHEGRMYSIGKMGSIIKIISGRYTLFAIVRLLRMEAEIKAESENSANRNSDSRLLEADLFGQGIWNEAVGRLEFQRGLNEYPLPTQRAYLMTRLELEELYKGAEAIHSAGSMVRARAVIGSYFGTSGTPCSADINKLFSHHCAVVGSTGSGKSCAVSAILHAALEAKNGSAALQPNIIIIDPHGEYSKAFAGKSLVYRAYSSGHATGNGSEVLRLPYWILNSDEFRSLLIGKTEHEATSQNNIVYKALTHARMVKANLITPASDMRNQSGTAEDRLDEPRPKPGVSPGQISCFNRDSPLEFSLDEFERHIDWNQGVKFNASKNKFVPLVPSDDLFPRIASVRSKLNVLKLDDRLSFLMRPQPGDKLSDIVSQFTGVGQNRIKIIDLSGTPSEIAGVLSACLARLLFQYKVWQTDEERKLDPVLLVCEEAHRYVPNSGEAEYRDAQQSIRRIAKEGRKYGLALMLVSQRPSDLESTVLSQCGSWIVMRLTNGSDQEHVGRFLPDNLTGMTRLLPSLGRREALFVGEAAAIPSRIFMRELTDDQRPSSNDMDFVSGWSHAGVSKEQIVKVTDRWQSLPIQQTASTGHASPPSGTATQNITATTEDEPAF